MARSPRRNTMTGVIITSDTGGRRTLPPTYPTVARINRAGMMDKSQDDFAGLTIKHLVIGVCNT
mgnify:CR=1 FL=1